ncbi:hatching enzyme 1.2-like isoform X2 [Sitodiplosis mosellana]|uniref:hatching enzyme 1.2-like isoform X2 n=1 Tax=Sitodiplosis mosellana TaxID=263140 RepID=UPI002444E4E9|nr:hatching enzyme 1.2-like isoform X2 [Sitodiplosis mosellana]
MDQYFVYILLICLWNLSSAYYIKRHLPTPPVAKYRFNTLFVQQDELDQIDIEAWTPEDGTNVWEHSGLFEGDIMLYTKQPIKNGIIDEAYRWPDATIPYYIDDAFTDEEVVSILNAMQEYHDKTCVRFRPFVKTDEYWIDIKQDWSGCWSSVGMKRQGQIVNLGSEKCRQHGVIIHELMHAAGFHHQQSASDRDDYIIIHWDNIKSGREHNFNKYDDAVVSNFDVTYDYNSVMHYSAKAFSKNGNITIEPIYEYTVLGQRIGLSEGDIQKINTMYNSSCNNNALSTIELHLQMQQQQQQEVTPTPVGQHFLETVIKWFESIFGLSLWSKRHI